MTRLDLVICYHKDFEDEALGLARRLFARFDEAIDSLILAPIHEHDFSLLFNGQVIHSLGDSGSAPRVADLLAILRDESGGR